MPRTSATRKARPPSKAYRKAAAAYQQAEAQHQQTDEALQQAETRYQAAETRYQQAEAAYQPYVTANITLKKPPFAPTDVNLFSPVAYPAATPMQPAAEKPTDETALRSQIQEVMS